MPFRVSAQVWASPVNLPERVQAVWDKLEAAGWKGSYAVSSQEGIVPQHIGVAFTVDKLGATAESATAAVEEAAGGGFFSSWGAFKASFVNDVVKQSGKDVVNVAQRTAAAAERASWGIGFGVGTTIALVALAYVAFAYGPVIAGSLSSSRAAA